MHCHFMACVGAGIRVGFVACASRGVCGVAALKAHLVACAGPMACRHFVARTISRVCQARDSPPLGAGPSPPLSFRHKLWTAASRRAARFRAPLQAAQVAFRFCREPRRAPQATLTRRPTTRLGPFGLGSDAAQLVVTSELGTIENVLKLHFTFAKTEIHMPQGLVEEVREFIRADVETAAPASSGAAGSSDTARADEAPQTPRTPTPSPRANPIRRLHRTMSDLSGDEQTSKAPRGPAGDPHHITRPEVMPCWGGWLLVGLRFVVLTVAWSTASPLPVRRLVGFMIARRVSWHVGIMSACLCVRPISRQLGLGE